MILLRLRSVVDQIFKMNPFGIRSGVFIVNFEHISHIFTLFRLGYVLMFAGMFLRVLSLFQAIPSDLHFSHI